MEKSFIKKIKRDAAVISVILVLATVSLILIGVLRDDGDYAVVTVDGKEVGRYSLSSDTDMEIATEYGINVLSVKDGMVDITEADCPDGICEAHRPISKSGESIVCLPHKLVVKVESEEEK